MKILVGLLLIAGGLALRVDAQGTVNFANGTSTRVSHCAGVPMVASAGYRAELVYAPDGTSLDQFDAVAVRVGADTAVGMPAVGLYSGGARTAPTTTPGGFGLFQVRVWNLASGPDWRAVRALGRSTDFIGESFIMRIDTGDPTTVPPGTPTPLVGNGLTSIVLGPVGCVPEPSVIALGVAGVGVLLVLRWRQ